MMDFRGNLNLILRAVALLWTLLITALIGNVLRETHGHGPIESAVKLAMFVAVVSWIATLYGLASMFVGAIGYPIVLLSLDAFTAFFTFISGVVLAATLHVPNCSSNPSPFRGSGATKWCHETQASTAFMWFLFACFVGTTFFAFKAFRSGGGSVRTGPSMSQVGV